MADRPDLALYVALVTLAVTVAFIAYATTGLISACGAGK